MPFTPLALDRARLAHPLELALKPRDPLLHAAPIDFELRFAGSTRADSTSLARKVMPHARETREQILQLRELNLQAPFPAARALREDIENQLRAIENFSGK